MRSRIEHSLHPGYRRLSYGRERIAFDQPLFDKRQATTCRWEARMVGRRRIFNLVVLAVAGSALWVFVPASARSDEVADFYAGKNVQLVIGYATGGGYDDYARLLGRHIGRHIPGHPTVVVQNMPGAGSIRAANYLYNIAPKDGTVFGGFARGIFIDPLLGRGDAMRYTAAKFGWLGSISNDAGVCAFRSDAGIESWADMQTKRYKIGATGAGADSDVFSNLLRKMFNLPMQLVLGYQSAAETVLAIQRKEVDGRCGWSWSTLSSRNRDMWQAKQIRVVLQLTDRRIAELAEVPTVLEVAQNPEHQAVLKLIVARQTMARPFVAPPGIPPERLTALRNAFDATMQDPEFFADARRQDLDVRPVTGTEADALIAQVYAAAPDVVKRAAEYMKEAQ
ncbi:MAG TPA: tripartite tricarboxylate transporter substrate-binding protein [Xanthobacteraceae bacterium]|nr:tripartite tricarboxylate transporter substrate-binding protein [Xanthobacteraceae bacterium]